jgi:hypothetical protein
MRCKTCMWFVPKQAADGITDLGRCRRHAPTGMGFPPVFVNDWCGDHRLDENRVASISRSQDRDDPVPHLLRRIDSLNKQLTAALNRIDDLPHQPA